MLVERVQHWFNIDSKMANSDDEDEDDDVTFVKTSKKESNDPLLASNLVPELRSNTNVYGQGSQNSTTSISVSKKDQLLY